jgi:hypothetical protein
MLTHTHSGLDAHRLKAAGSVSHCGSSMFESHVGTQFARCLRRQCSLLLLLLQLLRPAHLVLLGVLQWGAEGLAPPSELSASPSELLASPSELLASPSELSASPSELSASHPASSQRLTQRALSVSPSELSASPSELSASHPARALSVSPSELSASHPASLTCRRLRSAAARMSRYARRRCSASASYIDAKVANRNC